MYSVLNKSKNAPQATICTDVAHEALAQLQFDKLLHHGALVPLFQPIVRAASPVQPRRPGIRARADTLAGTVLAGSSHPWQAC
jgi:hypothetical protein